MTIYFEEVMTNLPCQQLNLFQQFILLIKKKSIYFTANLHVTSVLMSIEPVNLATLLYCLSTLRKLNIRNVFFHIGNTSLR